MGGTLLRTIIDFVLDPVYGPPSGANPDYNPILHLGVGMPTADVPLVADWDPNSPYGEFMWRSSWSMHASARVDTAGTPISIVLHEGNVVRMDTTQKRRIRENMHLFAFGTYFERLGAADMTLAVGYTGRVLIQLP